MVSHYMGQGSSFEAKGQQRMAELVIFQLFLQAKMANNNEIWKEGEKGKDK